MNKKIAALIFAGLASLGVNSEAREPLGIERSLQKRINQIVVDSNDQALPEQESVKILPKKTQAATPTPYSPPRETARLELVQELDTDDNLKLGLGMQGDSQANPAELMVGIESNRGKISYTSDFKNRQEKIAAELNTKRGKIDFHLTDYRHAQINAAIDITKEVKLLAGHDSIARTNTAGIDYSRKALSFSLRNTAFSDGTHTRNARVGLKLPVDASASISHSYTANAGMPTNATSITLEKTIKNLPLSRIYANYSYATHHGQNYIGSKFGIEKKIEWLQVNAWAEKPAGLDQYVYGAQGDIKLSW